MWYKGDFHLKPMVLLTVRYIYRFKAKYDRTYVGTYGSFPARKTEEDVRPVPVRHLTEYIE